MTLRNRRLLLLFLLLAVLTAGGWLGWHFLRSPRTAGEYLAWFRDPDHGFVYHREVGGFTFTTQVRPAPLMALSGWEKHRLAGTATEALRDSLTQDFGDATYLMFEVAANKDGSATDVLTYNAGSWEELMAKAERISFEPEKYFRLVRGKDSLAPVLAHAERGYELGHTQRFLLAFPVSYPVPATDTTTYTFIYQDPIWGAGIQKFVLNLHPVSYPALPR